MSPAPTIPRPSLRYCIGVLATCLALATGFLLSRCVQSDAAPTASDAVAPFARTEAALNPEVLTLLADGTKLIGWISGTKEYKGQEVEIWLGEEKKTTTVVAGNHFQLPYQVDKPTKVSAKVGTLRQTITAAPLVKTGPTVFFVTDRHVYRPTQTLHFCGFLRELDRTGEWRSLNKTPVEVHLRSIRKDMLEQKFCLTSDDLGRIVGSYKFLEIDPIDAYELSIAKYEGKATLHLAEYRKGNVQLRIASERVGNRVTLRFEALDFLDQPVPARKVAFTAQLTQQPPKAGKGELNGNDFVHAGNGQELMFHLDNLSEDEQLLFRSDPTFTPLDESDFGGPTIASFTGEVDLKGKSTGTYELTLPRNCPNTGHALVVNAILTDASGREEHRSSTLPLTGPEEPLRLLLNRPIVDVNETIEVKLRRADGKPVEGTATLIPVKLSASLPPDFRFAGQGNPVVKGRWQSQEVYESVKRTLIAATVFKNDTATLKLEEPGAYKLLAFVEQPDGSRRRQEIGVIVQPYAKQPGLRLQLNHLAYRPGEELTGTLAGRFTDARVLLTLRDSRGYQWVHTVRTDDKGLATFKYLLAPSLRYGCVVTAQYANNATPEGVHVVSQTFHVEPTDRMIEIKTRPSKAVYGPGEKVAVDVQVDRQEPVDLIVSVYDKALATIKPTERVDIRSFYLADERGHQELARDHLVRQLNGVTIASLLRKVKQMQRPVIPGEEPDEKDWFLSHLQAQTFTVQDIVTLLNFAGIEARLGYATHENVTWDVPNRKATLLDILHANPDKHRLHLELLGNLVFVSEYETDCPLLYLDERLSWARRMLRKTYLAGPGFQGKPILPGNGVGWGGIAGIGGGLGGLGGGLGGQRGFNGGPALPGQVEQDVVIRRDFADLAYWNARLRTDAEGKAHFEFPVPDSLTSWQIEVVGVSGKMHVGTGKASFEVSRPIMVIPILPRLCTVGDKVRVSANVVNRSNAAQTLHVRLAAKNGKVAADPEQTIKLEAGKSGFVHWVIEPGNVGQTELLMSADCPAGSDASLKRLAVVAPSVEDITTKSGFCKDALTIEVPRDFDPARTQLEVRLAPTLMADLVDTLDYLVEYPYGCVEQTMSRFLPAIKVAQVLQKFDIDHARLKQKLPACVQAGIKRLLELQQPDGGWGWNGSSTTHEFMTPYALYGLLEAEKAGYDLGSDQAIQKGLQRLNRFITDLKDQPTDWIFCVTVYSHRLPLEEGWWKQIETLTKDDQLSDYALAMALELASRHRKKELIKAVLGRLNARAVEKQGHVSWRSGGFQRWTDDPLEITAAVLKALASVDPTNKRIPGILLYLNDSKQGNHWNSTRDTAMIVEALCTYLARQNLNPAERLQASFQINEGKVQEATFDSKILTRKWTIPGTQLQAGTNRVRFPGGTAGVMVRLALRRTLSGKDLAARDQGLEVTRTFWLLDEKGNRVREVKKGDTIPAGSYLGNMIKVQHKSIWPMRYVLVENPRSSSCELIAESDVRFNQQTPTVVLREDRETHVAWHHEKTPAEFENHCVFHAELPGEFVVGPAVAELMYQPEKRGHSDSFHFRVAEN